MLLLGAARRGRGPGRRAGRADARAPLPTLPGTSCPVFPADNPWNQRVDRLPGGQGLGRAHRPDRAERPGPPRLRHRSTTARRTGSRTRSCRNATKRVRSASSTPRSPTATGIRCRATCRSRAGRGSSGDRHVIVVNKDTCTDYELFAAYPHNGGARWTAGLGRDLQPALGPAAPRRLDLGRRRRPADPRRPGPLRRGGARARSTTPCVSPRRARAATTSIPARHEAGTCGNNAPPMGLRVRLKASVNISRLPYQARVVAQALKTYGMILADNGSPWFISGAPSPHWNDDALHQLDQLTRARLPGRGHELAAAPRPLISPRPRTRAAARALARGVKTAPAAGSLCMWGDLSSITDTDRAAAALRGRAPVRHRRPARGPAGRERRGGRRARLRRLGTGGSSAAPQGAAPRADVAPDHRGGSAGGRQRPARAARLRPRHPPPRRRAGLADAGGAGGAVRAACSEVVSERRMRSHDGRTDDRRAPLRRPPRRGRAGRARSPALSRPGPRHRRAGTGSPSSSSSRPRSGRAASGSWPATPRTGGSTPSSTWCERARWAGRSSARRARMGIRTWSASSG